MKRIPMVLTIAYLSIYATVLIRNACWPVGDQTDVIRVGIAAFPAGFFLSFFCPEERNGTFIAISVAAVLNASFILYGSRLAIREYFTSRQSYVSVLSLRYIGTAARRKLRFCTIVIARRFRLADKKEAAGVCRGCGESMDFQSQMADY